MKRVEHTVVRVRYVSSLYPEIWTKDERRAADLQWADTERAEVYNVVQGTKSAPYGANSWEYLGYARGDGREAVVMRITEVRRQLSGASGEFFKWRAGFTLDHYGEKGFAGGCAVQHDGKFQRSTVSVDWTPGTRGEVVERFRAWAEEHWKVTKTITLGGVQVWP